MTRLVALALAALSATALITPTAAHAAAATTTATATATAVTSTHAPAGDDGWAGVGTISAPGGPSFTDQFGRAVSLHGADLAAKCGGGATPRPTLGRPCVGPDVGDQPAYVLTPGAVDIGRRFTAADAASLAGLGFDMVRLGIVWEGMEPGPAGVGPNDPTYCTPHAAGTPFPALGAADPYDQATVDAYLDRVSTIVSLLAAHGIRVILDMHQDAYGSAFADPTGLSPWNGEGAPPWATCTNDIAFQAPLSWGHAGHNHAVRAADHNFMANDVSGDLQGQFVRVWQAVARHFAHNPDVLGYELLNEPTDFTLPSMDAELECDYGGPVHEPASCTASGAQAPPDGWIGAIRAVDPGHVVFYEPPIDNQADDRETIGIAEPLRFANLAFAFHMYHPVSFISQVIVPELTATHTLQPGGPPAVMDEFGGTKNYVIPGQTVAAADALHLSWSYWAAMQLHDPTGNPREWLLGPTGTPDPDKARVLAVPYALATAGTPGPDAWAAGPRRFTDSYAPNPRIHQPTVIEVPPYTFPHGYAVRVSGARITSRPGGSIVELAADRGARRVTVTVTPPPAPRHPTATTGAG